MVGTWCEGRTGNSTGGGKYEMLVIRMGGSRKGQTWPLKEIAKTRITAPAAFDVSIPPSFRQKIITFRRVTAVAGCILRDTFQGLGWGFATRAAVRTILSYGDMLGADSVRRVSRASYN
jgi:hypothetical protein